MRITLKNFAQLVCDACCIDGVPSLSYCKVCKSLAVLSEVLSSKGACISFLRCSDVEVCCIARKLPDELEVLLVIVLSNALVFAVVRNAISLNTLLAISPRVVFLIKRLWCQWPSHQRVLIVPWNFDMSTRVRTTLAVSVANSCAVEFEAIRCALVQHGAMFVFLYTVLWAAPG